MSITKRNITQWFSSPWSLLALAGVICIAIVIVGLRRTTSSLPIVGHAPAFEFRNQSNQAIRNANLRGKVWVANFFFLSCKTSCPKLTARMAELQNRVKQLPNSDQRKHAIQLISITVDPENDTPELLTEYAARYHADHSLWWFLTGKSSELEHIIVNGFKVHYSKANPNAGIFDIMHGDWFILVDSHERIRGYYMVDEHERFEQLIRDLQKISHEKE